MKWTLVLIAMSLIGAPSYLMGYEAIQTQTRPAHPQVSGVVPFSLTRETREGGKLIETQTVYRGANGDEARYVTRYGQETSVVLHILSNGHFLSMIPSRSRRLEFMQMPAGELAAFKKGVSHPPDKCKYDKTWAIDPIPVQVLGRVTYHAHYVIPGGGAVDQWFDPDLGCESLGYTVDLGNVVGEVTKLEFGEPDASLFDEHPEFPLVPESKK